MTTEGWCSAVNAWMGYCRAKKGIYTTYTQPLVGLALDVHAARLDAEIGGDVGGHGGDVGRDPRRLRDHGRIDVADAPAGLAHGSHRPAHQRTAIGAAPAFVAVRKQAADVAERRRAEKGVGDGVQQRVGIRMAEQPGIVRNIDAAEDQPAPRRQRMHVVALSDAEVHVHFLLARIHSARCRSSG